MSWGAAINDAKNTDSFGHAAPWEYRLLMWANSAKATGVGYCLELSSLEASRR